MPDSTPTVPRLTYLRIKNYRALRDVEFRDLTPLTVLIGPNGSGKSTVLDALDFLAEAVRGNLVGAWEKRDRFRGMRTRGEEGAIEFEVEMLLLNGKERLMYSIAIDEFNGKARVSSEQLVLKKGKQKRLLMNALTHSHEKGGDSYLVEMNLRSGKHKNPIYWDNNPDNSRIPDKLESMSATSPSDIPCINWVFQAERSRKTTLSGSDLSKSKSVFSTRDDLIFLNEVITSYRLFHLTDDHLKGYSDAGPREKLSPNGDNLPNVLYYLHEKHPDVLEKITAQLRRWVPELANIVTEMTSDERLLLRFKDAPFEKPLPAQYMSAGTMRLAALFTLLYEPNATGLLGIEEPDNELHPLLLYRLAEKLGIASATRQLLVTTHSPMLLDALDPTQVWILHRGADGYTQATRTADIPNVSELVEDGSPLGYLWTSNAFTIGNPLAPFHPRHDAR